MAFQASPGEQFTWFSADLTIASRLDSFLIRKSSYHLTISCDIFPCTYSDHDFVILNLDFRDRINRGPGVWKFNNSLLNDVLFRSEIVQLIEQSLLFRRAFKSVCDFWESLKSDIKSLCISYSRRKSRIRCREKVFLTNQLILLKRQLATKSDSVKAEILDLETALSSLFTLKLEELKIRSRVRWLEEGETPSRFFLNMGNQRREKSYVSSILNSHDVEVYSLEELLTVHEQFYTLLYSEEPIDSEIQNILFSQVTSRLSQPESDSCEGPLSLEELTEALRISNKNKTPGPDGLTTEFYICFWDLLGPLLVDVFNECLANDEPCQSMKASLNRLVFERDDRRCFKNWRPITLLNSDYKIGSKALSLRLSKVLESIINTDQTCSVLHSSICSNLTLLRDTLHFIDRSGETGIPISLDQEKAFDRVDRTFLTDLLNLFGFCPSFRIGYLHCITMHICKSWSMIFLPVQLSFHVASGKVMLCHLCLMRCGFTMYNQKFLSNRRFPSFRCRAHFTFSSS